MLCCGLIASLWGSHLKIGCGVWGVGQERFSLLGGELSFMVSHLKIDRGMGRAIVILPVVSAAHAI